MEGSPLYLESRESFLSRLLSLLVSLKENDIYVRWWDKERIDKYLRITIGTDEQMEALYAALDKICGG